MSRPSLTGLPKVLSNTWVATVLTLALGLALAFGGYTNIWPLFGASNQLLGGMTMIMLAVFCKCTGRKGFMLYVPVVFLLCSTFTSLVQSTLGCITVLQTSGMAVVATSGLQLVVCDPAHGARRYRGLQLPEGVLHQGGWLAARRGAGVDGARSRPLRPMPTRRIPPPTPRTLRHKVCTS